MQQQKYMKLWNVLPQKKRSAAGPILVLSTIRVQNLLKIVPHEKNGSETLWNTFSSLPKPFLVGCRLAYYAEL